MNVFLDTSAVVSLLIREETTPQILRCWKNFTQKWAWDWLIIEAEAALIRQKADTQAWRQWNKVQQSLNLIESSIEDRGQLRAFNRGIGLRAADAAHLFLFEKLSRHVDELSLVTFDREMMGAAKELRLPLHPVCEAS